MTRISLAILALAFFVPAASAQPRALPLSPGVVPGSPIGPGMQFVPTAPLPQNATSNQVFFPVALPWGWGVGIGYRTYNPWVGYGYAFGGILPPGGFGSQTIVVEPPMPAQAPQHVVTVSEEFPATLSIQIPASGDFWLNGKKMDKSGESATLTSPVLARGQTYTFDVKARWTRGGKTYEAKRSVTVGPGDNSRLMILSGDEVGE
jgi:uncharacterized protein (TIGR03000 family)